MKAPAAIDRAAAADVDLARANLYRYLAAAVSPPDSERFRRLSDAGFRAVVEAAVAWVREDPRFAPRELGPEELAPSEAPTGSLFPRRGAVTDAYARTFGHSVGKDCPPYELEYCANRDITFRSQMLADLTGFYRAFGLDRAAEARDRMDHLAFEAEFMQIVIARRMYAQTEGLGEELVQRCRDAERGFFRDHLGWWLAGFGARLQERGASRFYRSLGRLVRALSAVERGVLDLPPFGEMPLVRSDDFRPAGTDFSCGSCPSVPDAAGDILR